MKRIISFVLALTMILTFCACGAPGKLKPYLNGLQLGADATDMRKIASSLNEAGTINVNGIDFDLVYTEYLNGLSYIEYLTDKTLLLAHATTNSDHPTPQFEFDQESIVEADEIASNFLDQYNNAYEILVNTPAYYRCISLSNSSAVISPAFGLTSHSHQLSSCGIYVLRRHGDKFFRI